MRYLLVTTLSFLLLSCTSFHPDPGVLTTCPPPVWLDEPVARELEAVPEEGFEHFWAWMADIEVLNHQLAECQ